MVVDAAATGCTIATDGAVVDRRCAATVDAAALAGNL
jgi:hypothetical protein